ncbi:MAG: tRNA (adenosine(37)-N6)-dimethylallyltransferase MiaA [Bacteroidetes bacterium]|nr:tRNA (adenosine(37)-N6)-dimethylallyltransferase MiaA [Bacteroidota bacterium]
MENETDRQAIKPVEKKKSRALAIVGPTASGKTGLSINLAEKIKGEIISADSRQVYRFLNIGTAKPSSGELKQVRHHFIGILDPDQEYNAAQYGQDARTKIEELIQRGIQPVIVGGSGLYIKAVIDGFFEGPGKDPEIRNMLENEARESGAQVLFEKLKKVDPVSAAKMDATKVRRVVRALEVYYTAGSPLSHLHKTELAETSFEVMQYAFEWKREVLYSRINRRVEEMIEKGLVEEVRDMKNRGYSSGMNALNTVGYKEVFDFIDGKRTKDEMVDLIKKNTRHFAKRQLTWFRADKRIRWIAVDEKTDWNGIAELIIKDFLGSQKTFNL